MVMMSSETSQTAQSDADSIDMEDDFCIVDSSNVSINVDTSVVDSLTSSEFSLGSDIKENEESKTDQEYQEETHMDPQGDVDRTTAKMPQSDRDATKARQKPAKDRTKDACHVNPAFEDDDGFVVVVDDSDRKADDSELTASDGKTTADENVGEQKKFAETVKKTVPLAETDVQGSAETVEFHKTVQTTESKEKLKVQFTTVQEPKDVQRHPQIGHLRQSNLLRTEREHADNYDIPDQRNKGAREDHRSTHKASLSSSKTEGTDSKLSTHELPNTGASAKAASQSHVFVDQVELSQPSTSSRLVGEDNRLRRPASRSTSAVTRPEQLDNIRKASLPVLQTVSRAQSMRVTRADTTDGPTKGKSRKLLRELSFSDADAKTARNYGALRGGQALPRRKPPRQSEKENGAEFDEGTPLKVTPELKSHMLNLMQELLDRGKVHQVAVLEQNGGTMIESLPKWTLSHPDELGLVKAVTCTQQNMLKLRVGNEVYTLFKHGPDKMMGRAGDNVLVAEKTSTCVLVGVALDDKPGSCLYEVSELAEALRDKGW